MLITTDLLNILTSQAQSSPRLRMHYDLRDSEEDQSQRMLNAIEPGTVIPVHRHTMTSEDVIMLRGRAGEVFFDVDGNETARFTLFLGGESPAIHVPMGQYHTCRRRESERVFIGAQDYIAQFGAHVF